MVLIKSEINTQVEVLLFLVPPWLSVYSTLLWRVKVEDVRQANLHRTQIIGCYVDNDATTAEGNGIAAARQG